MSLRSSGTDLCHSTDGSCIGGFCQFGAPDKDDDGDGAIDAACTGGTDCDDDPAGCGSACWPGNVGGEVCDGFDNDCNGDTDEGCSCDYQGDTDGVCLGGGTLDIGGACLEERRRKCNGERLRTCTAPRT